jgi:hypothetical protein
MALYSPSVTSSIFSAASTTSAVSYATTAMGGVVTFPWTTWPSRIVWCDANGCTLFDSWADQEPAREPAIGVAPALVSEETRQRFEAEQRAHNELLRRHTEEVRLAKEEARKRARTLLMQSLTRDQQRSLEERQYFDLKIGGKHYRIRQGTHGNVRLVQGDQEMVSYCAQPDDVPAEDAMLAQKLMLETDEAAFLRVANARQLRGTLQNTLR